MSDAGQLLTLCVMSIAFHGDDAKIHELIVIDVLSHIEICEHDW